MNRDQFRRALRIGAAALLAVTVGAVGPTVPGHALGPVIAITPYEVTGSGGFVFHPTLSGRGETAGVFDWEMYSNGWALLDSPGQDTGFSGRGIAVSGNGCIALWTIDNGSTDANQSVSFGVTDRCAGGERELFRTNSNYEPLSGLALSHTGRFGVAVLPPDLGTEFDPNYVVRIDTSNGALDIMPAHGFPYFGWDPALGVDISDDGSVVVAVERGSGATSVATFMRDVVAWEVGSPESGFVSGPVGQVGAAGFPSISGDGRFVSFASTRNMGAGATGAGPWVYVADRADGSLVLASPPAGAAYHSSITRDASQVAFTAANPRVCQQFNRQNFEGVEGGCPGVRIQVAYGPTPGLTGGFTTETVSFLSNGEEGGQHMQPALSGNGRWVAWISNAGTALLGSSDQSLNGQNAFTRRRDPGLVVDPIDFGTIAANTSSTLATTVRNTGTDSVSLDSISATPGQFTIQGGGTCAGGSFLPPGATCTVNVRYAAPNNNSETTGSITVAEGGYDAISAAGRLIGRSSFTPPPTVATTTTIVGDTTIPTTTRPGTPTTTRPPTTTTTVPGEVVLTADPNPVDYGPVAIGIGSPLKTVTISNIGTAGGQLVTELTGAHPGDFYVLRNGCNEVVLAPGQSCTMDIMMIPLDGGLRTANLTVSAGDVSGDIEMRGEGHFAPRLLATPGAITTRGFTTIVGQGFPPGGSFEVRIGDNVDVIPVVADSAGVFRIPYSAFGKLELGHYALQVDPLPSVFDIVRGQLVVALPTFEPQGPGGPVFGEALIVTRGG